MRQLQRTRLVVAALLLGLAMLVLSGCGAVIDFFGAGQTNTVGELVIEVEICASGSTGCPDKGNVMADAPTSPTQLLLGFRIPTATAGPASFVSEGAEAIGFSESPTYASELERLAPTDATQKWVGYITGTINYVKPPAVPQRLTVNVPFDLVQGADGSPFVGPFAFRAVVGNRLVDPPGLAPERPVSCGTTLTGAITPDAGLCVNSPSAADLATNVSENTRDLGILAGGAISSPQGSVASVPFTLRYAGTATSNANFSLSATTTVPGGTASPNPPTLAPPSNSDTSIPVAVGIPPNAAPGTYDVVLTARLANGQARTQARKLTITNAPGGGAAGGPGIVRRAKLSVILPRGLAVAAARRTGVVVLIGSTKRVPARISIFQGPAKKAKAAKGIRLKSPGPTRVVLKSARLVPGKFRIVIRSEGRNIVRRGTLRR